MRRATPILIAVIGLLALVVDFAPKLSLPSGEPNGRDRVVETKLGLDLRGGLRVEYQAQPVNGIAPNAADLATIRDIIERRVNATGVAEPVVQTQGSDRIVVELPGAVNAAEVRKLVGATGLLEFVPLPRETYGTEAAPGPQSASAGAPLPTKETPLFGGDKIETANPSTDDKGARAVGFRLTEEGSKLFGTYTTKHVGEFFAIVLDGVVVSAPSIRQPITSRDGVITGGGLGGFSVAEMTNLISVLRYGSLPFPVTELASSSVSATLGADFLDTTLFGGAVGILLVLLFMLIYYRLPGLVAAGALIYYSLVVLALFRLIPVTLTLAGIAGFVLSVGMAVDANILIFERMREEIRAGRSLVPALESGFTRAWSSILDSNVSSLITAGILFWFGSSTIKGFALVLILGVLVSMFTAIVVTRTVLRFIVKRDRVRKAWLFGVTEEEWARQAAPRNRTARVRA